MNTISLKAVDLSRQLEGRLARRRRSCYLRRGIASGQAWLGTLSVTAAAARLAGTERCHSTGFT